jgi:hypothetical protein
MLKYSCLFVLQSLIISVLAACSTIASNSKQSSVCKQLSSDIVFNAATSNTREAEIQAAQAPLLEHNYAKENCGNPS